MAKRASIAATTAQADSVKHQSAIDEVTRDNKKLIQGLALESKQDNMVNNSSASAEIKRLQDQGDAYTRKIELERRRVSELDKQIALVQKKVDMQRKKMGGVNVSKQNNQVLSKQIRVMENRLDKAIVRYNEILGRNKLLKDKIDDLRKERLIFDGIYKKLEKDMAKEKKEMARLVDECNKAYKERDAAKLEIARLSQQADEEQAAFQAEWKNLGEMIERDKKAKDSNQLLEPDVKLGEMSVSEEATLKSKIAKGAWNIGKEKVTMALSQEKTATYEQMFARIQDETGVTDIDELVTRFVDAEDNNFKLFNRVNELNSEIESLEQQIAGLDGEIERYRGQGLSSDTQRKRILLDLEKRLEQTNSRADVYELKYSNAQRVLQQLKSGIQVMFDKLASQKDVEAFRNILGDDGVTEGNVLQYLGVIEQRANEIIQAYSVSPSGDASLLQSILGADDPKSRHELSQAAAAVQDQPLSPKQESALKFPNVDEIDAVEEQREAELAIQDTVEKPLTVDELKASMAKQMQEVQRQRAAFGADAPTDSSPTSDSEQLPGPLSDDK